MLVGIVHGRFQPLHIGHEEYIFEAKKKCAHLVIGITNSEPGHIRKESSASHRDEPSANRFNYYERMQMIAETIVERGHPLREFSITPFPISYIEKLVYFCPKEARHYITIYDDWGEEKYRRLNANGYDVEVLWRRKDKIITGTKIREMIDSKKNITPWVSNSVNDIIKTCKG